VVRAHIHSTVFDPDIKFTDANRVCDVPCSIIGAEAEEAAERP
jgi:hypothetical protein